MAAESQELEPEGNGARPSQTPEKNATGALVASSDAHATPQQDEDEDGEAEGDEDEDDEPKLKYTRLTNSFASVYRNGDATSSFTVAGDKMVRWPQEDASPVEAY